VVVAGGEDQPAANPGPFLVPLVEQLVRLEMPTAAGESASTVYRFVPVIRSDTELNGADGIVTVAGWPPLALFKALLIAVWHDLSDVRLAESLEDRASFRRFCGFSRFEPTPERTAFVRFRRKRLAPGYYVFAVRLRAEMNPIRTTAFVSRPFVERPASVTQGRELLDHQNGDRGDPCLIGIPLGSGLTDRLQSFI
jgi:hypothetical protein